MTVSHFGDMPDGTAIQRITLTSEELTANILTYGSILQDLRLEGHQPSLVLGFDNLADYLNHSPYFGATAGRCANRIRDGHLQLDGVDYQLDQNFIEKHHLHGGAKSLGKKVWHLDDHGPDWVTLSIELEDGEMGYPGNMSIRVTYRLLAQGIFDISFHATTDKTTLCNLAHHSYFNLDGSGTILNHQLKVDAFAFNPVDSELIPTGELESLEGSSFNFQQFKKIDTAVRHSNIDHNFCITKQRVALRPVAFLKSLSSHIQMEVRTTEPGLQVYDGAKLERPVKALDDQALVAYSGIALEPQVWPDANHHPHFPQAVLYPEQDYKQQTQFIFNYQSVSGDL